MIFESGNWEERAHRSDQRQAISLGSGLALPVTARSLTRTEAAGKDGGPAAILYLMTFASCLILIALVLQSGADPLQTIAWILAILGGSGLMFGAARKRQRRRFAYVDPEIMIEVAERGVMLSHPAGTHDIAAADLRWDYVHVSHDGSVTFMGIRLATPLGALELYDDHYVDGKKAAAAIVVVTERAKVEGGVLVG